jgi:two-component system sensor histidine kinase KdpD
MRTRVIATVASAGAVALATGAVFALRPAAPVLSLGVLYLFAVLPVAAVWGLAYAVPVSVVSMLLFNWLFLPPRHSFHLSDSENWVALAVYLVTAVSVSALAARARQRAEDAERALAELSATSISDATKTAVLRSVSHDLRSPLTAIGTASEMLSTDLPAEDRDELLASIRGQARRLDRLVANLLDLSRLEAGAASPLFELWTVDGLVAQALEAIGQESLRVVVAIPPDVPPVSVDAAQLERVLVNLLENALRHSSPDDPVEVTAEAGAGQVVIRVVDHGPGIPAGEQSTIFEPFEQGAAADARGSGLGLAIAKGFAELNGARLSVESEPGRGARFVLALPAVDVPVRV